MTAKSNLEQNQEILMEQLELIHKKIGRIENQSKSNGSGENDLILQDILKTVNGFRQSNDIREFKQIKDNQKLILDAFKKNPDWLNPVLNALRFLKNEIESSSNNQHHLEKTDAALIAIVQSDRRMQQITKTQKQLLMKKKWQDYFPYLVAVVSIVMLVTVLVYTKEMRDESFKRGKIDMIRTIESNYNVNLDKFYEN